MFDLLLLKRFAQKNKEKFDNVENDEENEEETQENIERPQKKLFGKSILTYRDVTYNGYTYSPKVILIILIFCIFRFLISCLAVYLVWTCNSETNIFLRLIMAILAFTFSWFYIIWYIITKKGFNMPCEFRY